MCCLLNQKGVKKSYKEKYIYTIFYIYLYSYFHWYSLFFVYIQVIVKCLSISTWKDFLQYFYWSTLVMNSLGMSKFLKFRFSGYEILSHSLILTLAGIASLPYKFHTCGPHNHVSQFLCVCIQVDRQGMHKYSPVDFASLEKPN